MLLTSHRCCFSGCAELADHTHHVTYSPEVTKPLCRKHHEGITILNGQQARKVRHGLSNKHRWWIWFQWVEGKLKPRRTRKALEYIEEWDGTPVVQARPAADRAVQPEQIETLRRAKKPKTRKRKIKSAAIDRKNGKKKQ